MEQVRTRFGVLPTYQITGLTRQCASTGRELRPGETFYSVLLDQAGQFVRHDYSESAWTGPHANAVAYWSGRIPSGKKPTKPTFNDELLFDCFNHLENKTEPARLNFRYVLALLLMRRKRLKFEDVRKQEGCEYLHLRDAKAGTVFVVLDPHLTDAEMATVQDEIFQVLGWS